MTAEQVIADALRSNRDHDLAQEVETIAAALRSAGLLVEPDCVSVPVEALRTVLGQRRLHAHERPGIWDWDGPRANQPCEECAARALLTARLDSAGNTDG